MATFGNTAQGASLKTSESIINAAKVTLPEDGTIDSLSAWFNISLVAKNVQGALYAYVSDTNAGALIATTDTVNVGLGADQQITCPFSSPPALSAGTYFIAFNVQSTTGVGEIYYDATGGNDVADTAVVIGTWPDPFAENTSGDDLLSFSGTYTAAAGGGGFGRPLAGSRNNPIGLV